jgi:hypothetical protein
MHTGSHLLTLAAVLILASCKHEYEYPLHGNPTSQNPVAHCSVSVGNRVGELVLPFLSKSDTEYAPGFEEAAFRRVRPGMSRGRVQGLLGKPLETTAFPDGSIYWYYSRRGPNFPDYFVRIVEFNANSRVVGRCQEFYLAP